MAWEPSWIGKLSLMIADISDEQFAQEMGTVWLRVPTTHAEAFALMNHQGEVNLNPVGSCPPDRVVIGSASGEPLLGTGAVEFGVRRWASWNPPGVMDAIGQLPYPRVDFASIKAN